MTESAGTASAGNERRDRLLKAPGVSGYEDTILRLLAGDLEKNGFLPHTDNLGNLWIEHGTEGPTVLLLAHLDEVGFVVSGFEPDGSLWISPMGHWQMNAFNHTPVDIITEAGTIHGVTCEYQYAEPQDFLRVDVGTESEEETLELGISLLQPVVFQRLSRNDFGELLIGRGIDNRVCSELFLDVAVKLGKQKLEKKGRVILAWTSQEEVGFRGTKALHHTLGKVDAAYSFDVFPAVRWPAKESLSGQPVAGAGPVLRKIDLEGIGSSDLLERVSSAALRKNIPTQIAYGRGNNQASVFDEAAKFAIDLPVGYLHSSIEMVHRNDISWMRELMCEIALNPLDMVSRDNEEKYK